MVSVKIASEMLAEPAVIDLEDSPEVSFGPEFADAKHNGIQNW